MVVSPPAMHLVYLINAVKHFTISSPMGIQTLFFVLYYICFRFSVFIKKGANCAFFDIYLNFALCLRMYRPLRRRR